MSVSKCLYPFFLIWTALWPQAWWPNGESLFFDYGFVIIGNDISSLWSRLGNYSKGFYSFYSCTDPFFSCIEALQGSHYWAIITLLKCLTLHCLLEKINILCRSRKYSWVSLSVNPTNFPESLLDWEYHPHFEFHSFSIQNNIFS